MSAIVILLKKVPISDFIYDYIYITRNCLYVDFGAWSWRLGHGWWITPDGIVFITHALNTFASGAKVLTCKNCIFRRSWMHCFNMQITYFVVVSFYQLHCLTNICFFSVFNTNVEQLCEDESYVSSGDILGCLLPGKLDGNLLECPMPTKLFDWKNTKMHFLCPKTGNLKHLP